MKKRDATRYTKLRSRRMSVPHASAATAGHLRPPRSFAGRPSSSRKKSESIVANSMTPRAIVGIVKSPMTSPSVARAVPITTPRIVNSPTIPLASPTCGAGTRSGM